MSAQTNQASILLTVEILPADAKGARRIIVSGAPANEMPEVRAGLFADRHALLDETYRALLKRGPQIIKHAAPKLDKSKPAADDDAPETPADDADAAEETESADTTLEHAILAAQSDEHAPPTEPEPFDAQLPLIENDPTNPQVEIAQAIDAEMASAQETRNV